MRKVFIIVIMASSGLLAGCKKFLDKQPLDSSSSETFFETASQMELGLNGVYAASFWSYPNYTPLLFDIEATTDLAIKRVGNAEDQVAMGDGGPFLIGNDLTVKAWNQAYTLVSRSNILLEGMKKGQANVDQNTYSRVRAEALVLRAWAYYHIMGWFGDPVYYTKPLTPSEYETIGRTPMSQVIPELYKDLDEAATLFDQAGANPILDYGRVNKGVALGLKARLAMLNKDFAVAADAAKAVMDSGNYGLNPNYPDLFLLAGQRANVNHELMFVQTYPTDQLNPQNWLVVLTVPRQVGTSQSSHFPSQALVDRFEGSDGKRIDQSGVYDPTHPSQNRDMRLHWTVYMQGDTMLHMTAKSPSGNYVSPQEKTIFNIYSNQRYKYNWKTSKFDTLAGNIDYINYISFPWFVSATGNIGGVGYVWRKYVDPTQYTWETKTGYVLMRYAEILLTYAEAKIELNQIDASVLSAINAVRERAGQPDVTGGSQDELRTLVRNERAVEFAGEGLRLIDLRRWDIYGKAVSGPLVGVSLDPNNPAPTPSFDNNDIPDYTGSESMRLFTRQQVRNNSNPKYKLWPIPQGEIDKNPNITQNPGWQ